jgi:predicted DNA-binding protein
MLWKRVSLNLPLPLYRRLCKLMEKYGMDQNNTIRMCISKVVELEGIEREK